jgi:hypothetical protein
MSTIDKIASTIEPRYSTVGVVLQRIDEPDPFYMNMRVFERNKVEPDQRISHLGSKSLDIGGKKYYLELRYNIWCAVTHIQI